MQPQLYSRIDLAELKAQLVKRVGAERSKRYFYYLNKLLSQKLSKREFDKLSRRELGGENVSLHNHFIRSILKNACQAKTPPPAHIPGPPKLGLQVANSSDGIEQSGSVFLPNQNPNAGPVWSNGVLPSSPKKGRSGVRGKPKDRPSPLGPNGKLDHEDIIGGNRAGVENGDANLCDYQRPVQHYLQPVAEMPEAEREAEAARPVEDPPPLLAPLGIPFCSASVGGSRKTAPATSGRGGGGGDAASYYDSGGLSDAESTRKRMERIAAAQGLGGGVSPECAETVNAMLDVYLKRLIRSCVELVGTKKKHGNAQKSQVQGKVVNGMWPSNHMHNNGGNSNSSAEAVQGSISLLDFKVAMELNPQQLGDDWPVLLEKISMHSFEE